VLNVFDSVPENIDAAGLAGLGQTLQAQPFVAADLAHIDPSAAPGSANRIVPAELVFLTPDIQATLIVTQATT
jgi:hypothetical protein